MRFRINRSTDYYESKQQAIECLTGKGAKLNNKLRMAFREESLTVDEFINSAVNGYSFCNLFSYEDKKYWIKSNKYWSLTYPYYQRGKNKGALKIQFKKDEHFIGSQALFYDIDYTNAEDMFEYIDKLDYKPTCGYYSYSNMKNKGGVVSSRFRLVYVFDEILNRTNFKRLYRNILNMIELNTGEHFEDDCGSRCAQYMNGGFGGDYYVNEDNIYSVNDFNEYEVIKYVEEEEQKQEVLEMPKLDYQMIKNMKTLDYKTFMHYYSKQYHYYYRTRYDGDEDYYLTDDNYLSLYYNRVAIKDGNHRRRKLYQRACLRRLMTTDDNINEILFNLYIDSSKFIDNSDGVITIDVLVRAAQSAYRYTKDEISKKFEKQIKLSNDKKPKFIVSDKFINKKEMVGKIRTKLKDEQIGELYDFSKSVKENSEEINKYFKVSFSRLYKFVNKNNLRDNKQLNYDYSKSVRWNANNLGISVWKSFQLSKINK